ncbi:MAG: hypothetical protein SFW35_13400 [Chitinophagales bacterium]|nr:hypothetical protein [Chitinophagales bacterium]
MTQLEARNTHYSLILARQMLVGAAIGLVLISIFLIVNWMDGDFDPEWPAYWYIRPLIVLPYAGAMGGVFYHLMDFMRQAGGWRKVLANILSLLVLLVGLWLGSVLGLVGTYWH